MEIRKKVDVFEVNYKCDKCEKGFMIGTQEGERRGSPENERFGIWHICSSCKAEQWIENKCYPEIQYQEKHPFDFGSI